MLEIIGTLIFILNDFGFIYTKTPISWLLFDYSCRVIVLGLIYYGYKKSLFTPTYIGLNPLPKQEFFIHTFILTAISLLLFEYVIDYIYSGGFLDFPEITNNYLFVFDLTVGIALVALSEELLFRGLIYNRLPRYKILISSILFGLIHWGSGFDSVLIATIIGVLFALSYKKTGSLYPAITAHFLVDFILFSEII